MTSPERWQEIDRIFAAALEVEGAARDQFLAQACKGDEDLRREVESLLAHDDPLSLSGPSVIAEATQLLTNVDSYDVRAIGPYEIVRSLGTGGMGHVYLAHDKRLNRPVAIKLLTAYAATEDERNRRFRQEALAASALNHPNILTIYEVGEVDGKHFIASEYVDGQTLATRMKGGPLPLETALDIAIQLASALSAAHSAGIVHRDIKPANIMIRPDGLVKVLDFGIAKYTRQEVTEDQETALLTSPGAVIGTAAYMSPEQARGYAVDPRTDIWSLGVILYEMVTGRRPFQGDTPLDLMSAVIERKPPSFSEVGTNVPERLEHIVFKSLNKDRQERYPAIADLLTDLRELRRRIEQGLETQPVTLQQSQAPAKGLTEGTSIAVMPFVNMSADPENEYFCDGLSEELLNALTKIEDLKVAARTSSYSFKGKDATVSSIGRALGVSSVLEGSVRKSGERLRITVQLINAVDGYHLWSERYDRELKDIFDVQDEIALSVVSALKLKLLGKEKAAVLKRHTESVEAYQLYLKGRYYWWKTAPEEFLKGRQFFERAVEVDPSYALSYCGISSYYGFGSAWGMVPPDVGWPRAVEANAQALKLDDTLSEVHTNMGGVSMVYRRDPRAAEKNIKRALELNPKFQEAHYIYSFFLLTKDRFDEAIAEASQALELDPLSARLNQHLAFGYYLARRYDEAISQYQQAIVLDSQNAFLHESLAGVFALKDLRDEAIVSLKKALELSGGAEAGALLNQAYAAQGFEAAMRSLAAVRLKELSLRVAQGEYIAANHFLRLYILTGDFEQAFEWLSRACDERNVFPLLFHSDPVFDPLRADPRFDEILERPGLTPNGGPNTAPEETAPPTIKLPTETASIANSSVTKEPLTRQKKKLLWMFGLGALVLLSLLAGWLYWSNQRTSIESIAVLPFENESGNGDLEYLSDGITDSLINSLSQLPNLSVKARSSVFRYKGKEIDPQRVGSELSVQAILSGRFVQRGDDVTLYLTLVNASNGNQLWGDEYDRKARDLVTLPKEIARDVARKLRTRLSGADEQRVLKDYTANGEAYRLYLSGRYHIFKLTPGEIQRGIGYLEQAIALDENYALAYAGLSDAYRGLALGSETLPLEFLPKSKEAAMKAVEIDDSLPEAHTALGMTMFWYDWKWDAVEAQFKRALQLNPNDVVAHMFYAHLLSNIGRHDESLAEVKRAIELDPLSPFANSLQGQFLNHAGHIDEAIQVLQKTIKLEPNFWMPHLFLASTYIDKGMYPEAIAEAQRATELSSAQTYSIVMGAYAMAKSGKQAQARVALEQLLKRSTESYVPQSHIAMIYNSLGEHDKAIEWLERAYRERDPKLTFLKVEPKWNNLRSDPRFASLIQRMGL